MGSYDGKGGTYYSDSEKPAVIRDLLGKIEQCNQTANTYERIGYSGHAASARHQADVLGKAIARVSRGESTMDYERRGYNG